MTDRIGRILAIWFGCGLAPKGPGTMGTLGAIPNAEGAGIRSSSQMEIEIRDPRRQRSIVHRYRIQSLPVVA